VFESIVNVFLVLMSSLISLNFLKKSWYKAEVLLFCPSYTLFECIFVYWELKSLLCALCWVLSYSWRLWITRVFLILW
jgi:hypothetical protein